jgi:hypothetical protein
MPETAPGGATDRQPARLRLNCNIPGMKEFAMRTRIAALAVVAAAGIAVLVGLSASPASAATTTSASGTTGVVSSIVGGGYQTLGRIM